MAENIAIGRDAIFAEEAFVVQIQGLLHQIMEDKGITRADLARAMNVSRPRITQIFSDECTNLTVRLLARAMHALGENPELVRALRSDEADEELEYKGRDLANPTMNVVPMWDDETDANEWCWPANDNRMAGLARHYGMAA